MGDSLIAVLRTINKLLHLHRELIALAWRQKEALTVRDEVVLSSVLKQLSVVSDEITALELKRVEALSALATEYGSKNPVQTEEDLVKYLGPHQAEQLTQLIRRLRLLHMEFQYLNERNKGLTAALAAQEQIASANRL